MSIQMETHKGIARIHAQNNCIMGRNVFTKTSFSRTNMCIRAMCDVRPHKNCMNDGFWYGYDACFLAKLGHEYTILAYLSTEFSLWHSLIFKVCVNQNYENVESKKETKWIRSKRKMCATKRVMNVWDNDSAFIVVRMDHNLLSLIHHCFRVFCTLRIGIFHMTTHRTTVSRYGYRMSKLN